MTEAEWLASGDPDAMFAVVRDRATDRRHMLLTAAWYSRGITGANRDTVDCSVRELIEAVADNALTLPEIDAAKERCRALFEGAIPPGTDPFVVGLHSNHLSAWLELVDGASADSLARWALLQFTNEADDGTLVQMCSGFRDIFGNPFRPVSFLSAWRTDTAVSLARGMYESREFGAMPILADALQDAGCEDEQILNHCRDASQVHVRGCWVCDLVLGKD